MIDDKFGALLQELSDVLKIELTPDSNNNCKIEYPDKMVITMEPNVLGDHLRLIVEIDKPGDGRYREEVLKEALLANNLPPPRNGIFCYGAKSNLLLLYDSISFEDLSGVRLAEIIDILLKKGRQWKESIQRGELPTHRSIESKGGMFGL